LTITQKIFFWVIVVRKSSLFYSLDSRRPLIQISIDGQKYGVYSDRAVGGDDSGGCPVNHGSLWSKSSPEKRPGCPEAADYEGGPRCVAIIL